MSVLSMAVIGKVALSQGQPMTHFMRFFLFFKKNPQTIQTYKSEKQRGERRFQRKK